MTVAGKKVSTKDKWVIKGYFGRLEHAVDHLVSQLAITERTEDLKEVLKNIEQAKVEICHAVQV